MASKKAKMHQYHELGGVPSAKRVPAALVFLRGKEAWQVALCGWEGFAALWGYNMAAPRW